MFTETWLYVNDEPLDLGLDPIPVTRQAQNLADLDAKLGSFTRSFVVPKTDKNQRLLELSFNFNTNTQYPYKVTKGKLVINGVEFGAGNLIVENNGVSETAIRLTFYLDSSPFYQLINSLSLWDCNLGEFDTWYDYETIMKLRKYPITPGEKVLYPIIDYADENRLFPSTATDVTVCIDKLFPAIYFKDLLRKVSELTGYQFTGKIFDPALTLDGSDASAMWANLIWPFSGSDLKRDTALQKRYTYTAKYTGPPIWYANIQAPDLSQTDLDANGKPIGRRDDGGLLPIYGTGPIYGGYESKHHFTADRVVLNLTCKGTIQNMGLCTFLIGPSAMIAGDLPPRENSEHYYGRLTAVNGVVINGTPVFVNNSTPRYQFDNIPAGVYDFEINVKFTSFRTHREWYVSWYNTAGFFGTGVTLIKSETRVVCLGDGGTDDEDRFIRLTYPDRPSTANMVEWGRKWFPGYSIVPNWTIGKFLKGIAQLFGCFILVDEKTKNVRFYQIRELYERRGDAIDWSDKLVNKDQAVWNTRSSAYGQKTVLMFSNEEGVNRGPGEYAVPVMDTTLPTEKILVQAPWSATVYDRRWAVGNFDESIGIIKRFKTYPSGTLPLTMNAYEGKDGQRILYVKPYTGRNVIYAPYPNASPKGTYSTVNNPIALTYFGDVNNTPNTLGYDKSYKWHYRWLDYITNSYKQITVYLYLTAGDINAIDFTKPVYLSQYGSYFFVQKIKDWLPGKPVAVELVKL